MSKDVFNVFCDVTTLKCGSSDTFIYMIYSYECVIVVFFLGVKYLYSF